MVVSEFLKPDEPAPAQRTPEEQRRNSRRRTDSLARAVVGALGIALPFVLWLGEPWIDGSFDGRGSLSAYYHSGVRDYFVATLAVVGALLLIYKFFQHSLDNLLTLVAGATAIGVAIFPTHVPDGIGQLPTPLQEHWDEDLVAALHYGCATVFFGCMAFMSFLFGISEAQRTARGNIALLPAHSSGRASWVHWVCAAVVALAILLLIVTRWVDVFGDQDIVIAESVALIAFGLSWSYKGLELDLLVPSLDPD